MSIKGRWRLARARWSYCDIWTRRTAVWSLFLAIVLLLIPYPDNDAVSVAAVIIFLFFVFTALLAWAKLAISVKKIDIERRPELNAIRREYGLKEK